MHLANHPLTVEDLRSLIAQHVGPCVSIYLPTRRGGGPDDRQRYEGLVRRARELLGEGRKNVATRDFLAPLAEQPDEFWREQLDGLAVFHARDLSASYALPAPVPELAIVADSFHIRPLLRLLQSNQHYYLLSLAQNHVGFFRGDADGLRPTRVPGLPKSLVDALGQEQDNEKTVSSHSTGSHGNMPMFHGQGKEDSSHDEDIARFVRAVDKALWPVLREEKAPLIFAATERLHPTFHSITRYAHVTQEGIHGNFETAALEQLHKRAWPIVQKRIEARGDEVHERYEKLVSRARALDEIRAIAQFAVQGRVGELLLAREARVWGTLDKASGELRLHGDQQQNDDDVLDDIAEAVLLRGGEVISFEQSKMPTKGPIAAILRW